MRLECHRRALLFMLLVPSYHCLELEQEDALSGLPLQGTGALLQGKWQHPRRWDPSGSYSSQVMEARSSRMKRDMFYFPLGSSLSIRFQFKSFLYNSTTTPTSSELDYFNDLEMQDTNGVL